MQYFVNFKTTSSQPVKKRRSAVLILPLQTSLVKATGVAAAYLVDDLSDVGVRGADVSGPHEEVVLVQEFWKKI